MGACFIELLETKNKLRGLTYVVGTSHTARSIYLLRRSLAPQPAN